jgi:ethanolamine ammonia-lyase small subunit
LTDHDDGLPAVFRADPWQEIRTHTTARVALGRAGVSLPTAEVLRFGLAHAQARDAVHLPLDAGALAENLRQAGFRTLRVASQADNRQTYLLRPDLGRRLHPASRDLLAHEAPARVAVVIADGLSAIAAQAHALPVLSLFRDGFSADWGPANGVPVIVAEQGRVALGDEIGAALDAELVIVMLGERPGLSSPDSLGIYITFAPRPGRMDSERNCISNIRPAGLDYGAAARRLAWLAGEACRLRLTGVALKDDSALPPAMTTE